MDSSSLWVFKYAPETLDQYIATPEFKQKLEKIIAEVPNCLLYGHPGTGKSAFVNILAKATGYPILKVNASDENGIPVVRDKIMPFARSASLDDFKLIYLNECDRLTNDAQEILRDLIEEVQAHTRFILVANDISSIHQAILSRCYSLEFNAPEAKGIAQKIFQILKSEHITAEESAKKEIVRLIKHYYPDIRRILNVIQGSVVDYKLTSITDASDNLINELVNATHAGDFDAVRSMLRNNSINYVELYRKLFETVDDFKNVGDAVLAIGDALYRDKTMAIKEINYLHMMAQMLKSGCM